MFSLGSHIGGGGSLIIPSETAYGLTESSTAYYDTYIKVSDLGHYDFEVEAHEIPSNEILPIIDKSYFPITVSHFQSEIDNTAPSAIYKSKPVSKVDVVFAFGETDKSDAMQKYIPSFESRLQSAGNFIDAHVEKVETSTIDISSMSPNEIINEWKNYPGTKFGGNYRAGWMASSSGLYTTANVNFTGFYSEQYLKTTDATHSFKMAAIGTGDPQGWVFRISEKKPDVYSFYALEINEAFSRVVLARIDSWVPGNYATHGGPLYHGMINGQDGTYSGGTGQASSYQGAVGEILGTARISSPIANFEIENYGNNIKVSSNVDGLLIDYTDNSNKALKYGSFGPYTCSEPGAMFSDIVITIGTSKSLGEAISDVSWRDNSTRFVVYAEDTIPEYMKTTDNKDYQYTVTKLLNSNAYLVNLGTSLNQATLEQLVKFISTPTEQKGTFILNNSTTQSMNDACDWIIEKVRNLSKPEDWILVNTEVIWETEYNDQEHDLPLNFGEHDGTKNSDNSDILLGESWGVGLTHLYKNEKIFAEKWRYRHFNNYFDNSTIRESYHNTWIEDPITIFPNPGLYRVNYKRRDNPLYPDVNLTHNFDSYRYWSENYDRIQ